MISAWPYIVFGSLTVFIAYLGVLNNRDISRIRSSSELLHSILQDERLEDACLTLSLVKKSKDVDLEDFAGEENDKTKLWLGSDNNPFRNKEKVRYVDVADDILHILCYYDFIASGIKRRVYDEQVLNDSLYSRVVGYWKVLEPFVLERRNLYKQETMFQDFQALAKRWEEHGKPLKPNSYDFDNIGLIEEIIKTFSSKIKEFKGKDGIR